tara:strand:+ start:275 stop:562 length:288 start_codon:yes stop_codon:yes gene_type:complete
MSNPGFVVMCRLDFRDLTKGVYPNKRIIEKMAKTSPAEFVRQVRQEVSKVTWPTRKETMVTTVMVFIMAAFMALFFLLVDQGLSYIVSLILGLGG